MSLHDWLLFLHVLSAFILVAAEVLFTFLIAWLYSRYANRRLDPLAQELYREMGGRR